MNKKKLFPLALVPLAATSLQAQSNIQTGRTDKRPNIILFFCFYLILTDTFSVFYIFLNNAVIYSLLLPEIQSQALFLP